jgi:holdfast attachment protein HfaA
MNDASTLPGGLQFGGGFDLGWAGAGAGAAISNQMDVTTNGSFNTVIIDNTQINNGDQTAIFKGE